MAAAAAATSAQPCESAVSSGFLLPSPTPTRGKAMRVHSSPDGKLIAYGAGQVVVVRSVEDFSVGFVYEEHLANVLCASFSPDGEFIASGDVKGEVRVWAVNDLAHTARKVLMGLPGGVEDIAWDSSGSLLAMTGQGTDKARICTVDSGTDMGTMKPMSKTGLAVAASAGAPSGFAFAGEDKQVLVYTEKPAKLAAACTEHTGFVNAVAFSPDGKFLVTASADKAVMVRDAATGAVLFKAAAAHKGSVYNAVCSPDGASLATSSADKTVKVWTVGADGALTQANVVTLGKAIPDMQNGLVWPTADTIISVSLSGAINVIDPTAADPKAVVTGPAGAVTSLAAAGASFVTGDAAGDASLWSRGEGREGFVAVRATGAAHGKRVSCVAASADRFVTGAYDDTLRFGSVAGPEFSGSATVGALPRAVTLVPACPEVAVVATSKFVKSFSTASGAELGVIPAPWEGRAVAASPTEAVIFVGGEDGSVHRVSVSSAGAIETSSTAADKMRAAVASLAVSPDGKHLAVGDAAREVQVLDAASLEPIVKSKWTAHTSRVVALAFSPSGDVLASSGVDRHVFFWSVTENHPIKRCNVAIAAPATGLVWEADGSAVWVSASNGVVTRVDAAV
ncbi:hypothetical protein FNF27_06917 [Cafeteria roenbergensis]|uniref:Uncharacterized protein n=1 Tax=Cafeteria roenbergensis TaxID=33653 RepID=A0A5A8DVX3_CAFRO|nr:hypothetical protein FNF27_06917 [Cafeteria roenbergensis]|mmetsp:Transcript_16835/g.63841  ORF Transcript_16835/g.63841 Transcript_16835/m.63841 type:complete len:623 (-) Transcript_16835:107-1975(-)